LSLSRQRYFSRVFVYLKNCMWKKKKIIICANVTIKWYLSNFEKRLRRNTSSSKSWQVSCLVNLSSECNVSFSLHFERENNFNTLLFQRRVLTWDEMFFLLTRSTPAIPTAINFKNEHTLLSDITQYCVGQFVISSLSYAQAVAACW